ncbi:MAG: VOC family protein [Opitutae bacterium]|nr:VOC family protein [Opitutae bacterium]
MKILEIAFFGYPVTDLRRARRFYETTLGLAPARIVGDDEHGGVEYEVGGATLSITNRLGFFRPARDGGMAVLEVADFDAALAHLRAAGVTMVAEPFESPACRAAVFADPDGNSLGLHRRK